MRKSCFLCALLFTLIHLIETFIDNIIEISFPKKPYASFITTINKSLVSPEAIDYLERILCYDHMERLTPRESMTHPYFEPVVRAAAAASSSSLMHHTHSHQGALSP